MLFARREKFESLSLKIGKAAAKLRVSPNAWTLLSLLFAAGAAYFVAQNSFAFAAALFAVFSLIDVVDGSVARATGRATSKGAYLDTTADRYAEFIFIAGLFFASLPALGASAGAWLLLYLFGSMMTTYAKAAAREKLEKSVKGGLLERAERMIILFVGLVLAVFDARFLTYIIVLLAVLSNISALQRIAKALH